MTTSPALRADVVLHARARQSAHQTMPDVINRDLRRYYWLLDQLQQDRMIQTDNVISSVLAQLDLPASTAVELAVLPHVAAEALTADNLHLLEGVSPVALEDALAPPIMRVLFLDLADRLLVSNPLPRPIR